MSVRRSWWLLAVGGVALLAGCPEEFPPKPQIRVIFDPENPFDYGKVFVGASQPSSIAITNKGLEDLVITSVTLGGDPVFTRYRPPDGSPNPTVPPSDAGVPGGALSLVPANKSSYLTVLFAPTADRSYSGTVTIASNAENFASVEVPLLGIGCAPDLPDGGRPPGSLCEL